MNTQVIAKESIALSGGVVRPNEQPLYLGTATFPTTRNKYKMSVTCDRMWYWVRFDKPLMPEDSALMQGVGFFFSKNKRAGWGVDLASAKVVPANVVRVLRSLGYAQAQVLKAEEIKPVEKVNIPVSIGAPDKGKGTTILGLHQNKAGRWVDAGGQFVSKDVIEKLGLNNGNGHPPVPVEPTPVQEAGEEYEAGWEAAIIDMEDDPDYAPRNASEMAMWAGVTLTDLLGMVEEEYIHGYLAAVNLKRPPVSKGLRSRLQR